MIDTATNRKVADIEVGQKPVQVGFSPDNRFVLRLAQRRERRGQGGREHAQARR
ncbi:MAG: hypothetical protein IPO34_15925 [Dehalococcoidia bacterium]|nr:hypothetical protein [Dehalococcoidia bacterium]